MNHNEKVGLIERVERASEDQAKRTLRSMIVKCSVNQPTIARAIKDAIERYTPTPTIVFQQPEPEDEDQVALISPLKKSRKKKRDEDGSSQEDEDVPSTTSKRQSTRRGDINPEPLVGKLVLKKTKAKLKRKNKHSSDHDEEQRSPDASSKNKSGRVSKPGAESEQRAHDTSMGQPSEQKDPTVIDLISSSDDETCDTVQSENESLSNKSSDDVSLDNDNSEDDSPAEDSSDGDSSEDVSSEDDSPDIVSADDEDTGNEQQSNTITGGSEPSQDGSNKRAPQASAGGSHGGPDAARSITVSMSKTSIQNDGIKMRPFGSTKKRKAPEQTVEEAHDEHAAQTATDTQANKRLRRTHPKGPRNSLENRRCRDCGVLFPSVAQLLGHRLYCKSAVVTPVSHHRCEPPWAFHPNKLEKSQAADTSADYSITDETNESAQLRVHPNGGVQAAHALSAHRHGFDTLPTNDTMDIDQTPLPPASRDSKDEAASYKLPLRDASSESDPSILSRRLPLHNKKFVEKLEPLIQLIHKCKRCGRYYNSSHNEAGNCQKGHTGTLT